MLNKALVITSIAPDTLEILHTYAKECADREIHFICIGNVFRSRLAEAYLNSLNIKGVEVSSSGVRANHAFDGDISIFVLPLLKREGLEPFISKKWIQTTLDIVQDKDLVVFMNEEV